MSDIVKSTGANNPADIQVVKQPDSNKDYFNFKATNLRIDTPHFITFQWVYADGTTSDFSPKYRFTTADIPTLTAPRFLNTDLTYFNGILNITWNGLDAAGQPYTKAFDRINVYVKDETLIGSPYRVVGSLRSAGTIRVAVPPRAHSVKLTVVAVDGSESDFSTAQFETPKLIPNTLPTGLAPAWVGTNFTLPFTHNSSEEFFSYYKITLTAGGVSKVYDVPGVPGSSSQSFALSLSQNRAGFGVPQTSFSGSIKTVNIYGNESSEVTFPATAYVNNLPAATIVATPISNGYSVSYTTPTNATFDKIEIEEIESTATTAPTTGYTKIFSGSTNPAVVIVPNTNKRWVRARFSDNLGSFATYGSAVQVEPTSPVVVDNAGPANVDSVSITSGIDTSGYLGFNAYADISWPAVTGGGIRGYRIRFSNDNNTTFSYVDSPGAGTTYRLGGLAIGATYKIAVATYDEYNNTSTSYVAGPDVTVTGTPSVSNYISGGPFQFGVGVGGVSTNKGLYFDASNYWYINASNSARLKVGGSTSNYLQWDGNTFAVDGNITARQGTFSGNVSIASGGSLYSGTLTPQGALSGAGYILNNLGLTFNSSTTNGITTIDGSTGLLTTASANIGGWNVTSSTINKTSNNGTVTLDSSNAQIRLTSTSYTAGIATPNTNAATDIVFWAGGSRDTNSNFYVRADGTVVMKSAIITGYASASDVAGLAKTDMSNVTTIDGGKITTGTIKSQNHSGTNDGSDFSTAGTAINLTGGGISAKNFRLTSGGDAFFRGTVFSEVSLSAPNITGGSITGASVTVTNQIISSGLRYGDDSGLTEGNDSNESGGGGTLDPGAVTPTLTLSNGKISSTNVLRLEGVSYTEIFAGGSQSAMFGADRSSMVFTTGLYLGDPNKSSSSSVQSLTNRAPWVTIDGTLRLRKGAPLFYPGGTAGAYVRNIYIKQTTSTPASTTGHVGDIFITY
jgi:hypothetical protein